MSRNIRDVQRTMGEHFVYADETFGESNEDLRNWVRSQIQEARSRRDWKSLPSDFEASAVRQVYERIKPHFEKSDIRARINSSKTKTFDELERALKI